MSAAYVDQRLDVGSNYADPAIVAATSRAQSESVPQWVIVAAACAAVLAALYFQRGRK